MSIQNITLRILAQSETPEQELQIAGGEGGIGAKGQPVRIQAVADVKYHLTDDGTGFAPENVATKRVGSDLYVAFEGASVDQPDLIIEGYYKDNGEQGYREGSDNLLVGTHENGNVYPFIPETAQGSDAVSMLLEGQQAGQVLGISEAPVPLWWLPLLAAPLLGGGGGSTPPPVDHKPEITNLTPKANGGDVTVEEAALAQGSNAASTAEKGVGDFTIKSQDGVKSLTIGGVEVIKDGVLTGAVVNTPLGNQLKVTGYDKATGKVSYEYTLLGSEKHPEDAAKANNSVYEDLKVVLTDNDGDKADATLSVQIVDDVPTATDDAAAQQQENQVLVIDALANDVRGADGVLPQAVSVTTQPAQGVVTYDPATGKFTYTPKANAGSTSTADSFTYTIIDADGDKSTATVKITLQPDSKIGTVPQDFVTVSEGGLPSPAAPMLRMRLFAAAADSAEAEGVLVVNYGRDVPTGNLLESIRLSADGLDAQLHALGDDVVWALSADGLLLTGSAAGEPVLTIQLLGAVVSDAALGQLTYSYRVELLKPVTHPDGQDKNIVTLKNIAFTVTDADGESKTGKFDIDVQDAVPVALDDANTVETEGPQSVQGQVLANDTQGADGAVVVGVAKGDTEASLDAPATLGVALQGLYGTLTLHADGSYSYTRTPGSAGGKEDVFTYTIKDADGDLANAVLTIDIGNHKPTVGEPNEPATANVTATVNEKGLAPRGAEPGGSGEMADGNGANDSDKSEATTGTIAFTSKDGVGSVTLGTVALGTDAATAVTVQDDGTGTLKAYYEFDAATGAGTVHYSYVLKDNVAHADADGTNSLSLPQVGLVVTDADGQTASGSVTITIVDDVP
ncbi:MULTISPECIES: Ig-like domain-containing protein, partial [Brachymonas]|uniref:Ig-like domain-containing protein n=1 Tax=Brachymonas TaxID=28219 RepID=UPI002E778A5A